VPGHALARQAKVEHVEVLFLLLFKRLLVDQTCISCQQSCVLSLLYAKGSLSFVSFEWKYGLGGKIWWCEVSSVYTFSLRQNPCQIVSNDFGLISNFTRVCLGYFGATLIFGLCGFELWKTENTTNLWEGVKIQILNFLNFP
jgi:hypothetical protein